MATATKKSVKKKAVKPELELMQKTVSNLKDIVSSLKIDVDRIKIRMGI